MKLTCYTIDDKGLELIAGRPERQWMDEFDARHPYRCLPIVMANTTGWEILCPCDFTATWNGGPSELDIRIDGDDDTGLANWFVKSHFSRGTITFHTSYLFRTEPGWDLWTGGPPNHIKDGIQPLCGIVESDWLPFPFTMNWHFTRPGMVSFKKGEVFCFIMPVPHASVEEFEPVVKRLADEPELKAEFQAWADSRNTFLKGLQERDPEAVRLKWQRHYYKGQTVAGATAPETHTARRRLKQPRPAKPGE